MKKRNNENFIYNIKQRHPKTLRSVTINTGLFTKKKSTDIQKRINTLQCQYLPFRKLKNKGIQKKQEKRKSFQEFIMDREDIKYNSINFLHTSKPKTFFISYPKRIFMVQKHPRIHSNSNSKNQNIRFSTKKTLKTQQNRNNQMRYTGKLQEILKEKSLSKDKRIKLKLNSNFEESKNQDQYCPWTKRQQQYNINESINSKVIQKQNNSFRSKQYDKI